MLRVLTYHRVAEPPEPHHGDPHLVSATPDDFEAHLRHLKRRYRVVSADQVRAAWTGERRLPRRSVLLTFDDAYRDFAEVVWPLLRRYGCPAVLFVPTAFPGAPDRGFWWDRLHHAFATTRKRRLRRSPAGTLSLATLAERRESFREARDRIGRLPHREALRWVRRIRRELEVEERGGAPVLGWEELRRLAGEGVVLGAHTRNHPRLTSLRRPEARREIRASRDDLEERTGERPRLFAYPAGAHDDRVVEMVGDAGFELAFTTRDGHNAPGSDDPLRLCRTNISLRTTPLVFRFRLLRIGAAVDVWRHRKQRARRAAGR